MDLASPTGGPESRSKDSRESLYSAVSWEMAQSTEVQNILSELPLQVRQAKWQNFGASGYGQAGANPVAQCLGSSAGAFSPTSGGVNLTITNVRSFRCLMYDHGPAYERGAHHGTYYHHSCAYARHPSNHRYQRRMPLRILSVTIPLLFAVALTNGCNSRHRTVTVAMLPGTYTFKSDAPISVPPSHSEPRFGDLLILGSDGTYKVERLNRSDASVVSGHWKLREGDPSTLYLDHGGYPIEFENGKIRLVVNNDVDARYEKLR